MAAKSGRGSRRGKGGGRKAPTRRKAGSKSSRPLKAKAAKARAKRQAQAPRAKAKAPGKPLARKARGTVRKAARGKVKRAVKRTLQPHAGTGMGVRLLGRLKPGYNAVLTPAALSFLAMLERAFRPEREALLLRRAEVQARLDAGEMPQFPPETQGLRERDWSVAALPADLQDRRIEITGPTDRKMVINALNCGASVFMADFEDATTPSWDNLIEGQINLRDAITGAITFEDPLTAKSYRLGPKPAVLMVRPRGWHLDEAHVLVDGRPMSGSLFDFGLYFFHNAKALLAKGSGPYFYLPKLESHLEARLWNQVFLRAQEALAIPAGTIKATVLIETILAAFEMDEILWELRQHSAGLNCGRWDYIFSFIKKFRRHSWAVMPDRAQVTMTTHFLRAYSQLLVRICHRRQVHAMGGMAAQIPIKNDKAANDAAMAKVRADKEREAGDGYDGSWIAHPGLLPVAKEVFDRVMPGPNQIARRRDDVRAASADLLTVPGGSITEAGLRQNIDVGIGYVEAWLRGLGCVPLHHLMEDAATAEISRAQVWQWRRYGAKLADGRVVDAALIDAMIGEQLAAAPSAPGGRHKDAAALFRKLVEADDFAEFLTLPAYDMLLKEGR
jgi:malate synthase